MISLRLGRLIGGLIGSGVLAWAGTPEEVLAKVVPLTSRQEAFDVRESRLRASKGDAAAFAWVEQRLTTRPDPHTAAVYADLLLRGKRQGAPENQGGRGVRLAQEALAAGSLRAVGVIGWELLRGGRLPGDPARGLTYLHHAAAAGDTTAMTYLGDALLRGIGTAPEPTLAEFWFRRAARRGWPYGLFLLGNAYADGKFHGQPDLARACALYQEAATYGSTSARRRLEQLAQAGDPAATRAHHLVTLWFAWFRHNVSNAKQHGVAQALQRDYPDDAEVLTALGRYNISPENGRREFKQAFVLLSRAAALGSVEAQALRARMQAEGWGTKTDPAAGLAEWRRLESQNDPTSLALLGYYSYWGTLKNKVLPKNPAQAFAYSKRAADAGSYTGQINTAYCYESGIGVPKDYALAAKYYDIAASRGALWADQSAASNLAFVED